MLALCCCQVPGYLGNSDMVGVEVGPNLPDLPGRRVYQLYQSLHFCLDNSGHLICYFGLVTFDCPDK